MHQPIAETSLFDKTTRMSNQLCYIMLCYVMLCYVMSEGELQPICLFPWGHLQILLTSSTKQRS